MDNKFCPQASKEDWQLFSPSVEAPDVFFFEETVVLCDLLRESFLAEPSVVKDNSWCFQSGEDIALPAFFVSSIDSWELRDPSLDASSLFFLLTAFQKKKRQRSAKKPSIPHKHATTWHLPELAPHKEETAAFACSILDLQRKYMKSRCLAHINKYYTWSFPPEYEERFESILGADWEVNCMPFAWRMRGTLGTLGELFSSWCKSNASCQKNGEKLLHQGTGVSLVEK